MIYVHIPFCRSFCTYCDFYSEVAAKCRRTADSLAQERLFNSFSKALNHEVSCRKDEFSSDVNTLYIGGGTPSVLPLSVYASFLAALKEVGVKCGFDEFTFEVNPEDIVEKGCTYVEGLMELGVNRVSMGVQSFDDDVLRWMNRRHDSATAVKAYSILEDAGLDNISIDLIFGMPQVNDDRWSETLDRALSISSKGRLPRHISSYQLSVEPGSALAVLVEQGKWTEAEDDCCARQYEMLCGRLAAAGYDHYEISNFAQPGYKAVHNSAYWSHAPYVGLGPGAHSFKAEIRQWNRPDLNAYISDPLSVQEKEVLNQDQLVLEKIMLGLRTSDGVPELFLRQHCGPALDVALKNSDLIPVPSGNLRIPEDRFFISDNIISEII